MSKLILASMIMVFSNSTFAMKSTKGQIHAAYFAMHLNQIQKPEDLLKIPLAEGDRADLRKDIKHWFQKFDKPEIFMPDRSTVKVKIREIEVPIVFADEGTGFKINATTFHFAAFNSYRQLQAAIFKAIKSNSKTTAMSIFIPQVWAEGTSPTIQERLSAFVASMSRTIKSPIETKKLDQTPTSLKPGASIEELLAAYAYDAKLSERLDLEHNSKPHYIPSMFTCEGSKLKSLSKPDLVWKGQLGTGRSASQLDVEEDGSYTFREVHCEGLKISKEGIVLNERPECLRKGLDFFKEGPFYQFPLVAQECCATKGCPEAVTAAIDKYAQEALNRGGPQDQPIEQ